MEKFLLHVCCGPCSVVLFEELSEQFEVTVHFYNPNIHPIEEYEKRKKEVIKICNELYIDFVEEKYEPEKWLEITNQYKKEPEGGKRCLLCFRMRLEKAAQHASEHGFDYFGTSLTSGRNKKAEIINPIGTELGKKYSIKFFAEDWKKKGRQEKANKIISEKGIYRQEYCGCAYSL